MVQAMTMTVQIIEKYMCEYKERAGRALQKDFGVIHCLRNF